MNRPASPGDIPEAGHPVFSGMFDRVACWENLLSAYKKASRGKRSRPDVAAFEYRLEDNLLALRRELRDKTYRPRPYTTFTIFDPKERVISAAHFRDRVVHHALCNLIQPVFEKNFISDSYANRKGVGTHKALDRCQQFSRKYKYVLSCDVTQYFPSIDHAILKEILFRKIADPDVAWLVEEILDSGTGILDWAYDMVFFPGDDMFALCRLRGLPLGNLTSQFWANVYLTPFDHFVKRELRCPAYLRYVDDFLLFSDSKPQLWRFKSAIETRLARYRLTIHQTEVRPVAEGIGFLGFRVFPQRRAVKRGKGIRYRRRMKQLIERFLAGELPEETVAASIAGWANHASFANTIDLRKGLLHIRGASLFSKCLIPFSYDYCGCEFHSDFVAGVVQETSLWKNGK